MTAVRWWQVLALSMTVVAAAGWMRGGAEPTTARAAGPSVERPRVGRGVRTGGAAASADDLVERMLAARDRNEVRALAKRLGAIGDDRSIDAVLPLVRDPRPGVPEAVVHAIGAIGTDHAVEVLAEQARRPMDEVRLDALTALGDTHNPLAVPVLVEMLPLAQSSYRAMVIQSLGELGTDEAVAALEGTAVRPADYYLEGNAIEALSAIGSPAARAALGRLIDSPIRDVAVTAIAAIEEPDDATIDKLVAVARSSDRELVVVAIAALGSAGDRGLAVVRDLARSGNMATKVAAAEALGVARDEASIELLGELMRAGRYPLDSTAARALAAIGTADARDMLADAALNDDVVRATAVEGLLALEEPDPDVLRDLAAIEGSHRYEVMGKLLDLEADGAFDLVIEATRNAEDADYAVRLLSALETPRATEALVAIGYDPQHPAYTSALMQLETRIGIPEVERIMIAALEASNDNYSIAANILGKAGTPTARAALIEALDDPEVAPAAMRNLERYRLDAQARSALVAMTSAQPEYRIEVTGMLLRTGATEGIGLARGLIAEADIYTGRQIASYLADFDHPDAKGALRDLARSGPATQRIAAFSGLDVNGDPAALRIVTDALRDRDPEVAYYAVEAVAQHTDREVILGNLAHDLSADEMVRLRAQRWTDDRDY